MTIKLATRHGITLGALHRVAWQDEQVTFHPPAITRIVAERRRFMDPEDSRCFS
jgi:hypothetical protein